MPNTPHPAPLRLATFLPFRLSVLSNAVSQRIAELYDREFGLSIWHWRVMAVTADTPGISATEVRKRIKEGGDWKKLVPDEVAATIESIEGVQRIKSIG